MENNKITEELITETYGKLDREAESGGYHLNPESEFTRDLVEGYLFNQQRYGYPACPCRKATGVKEEDIDIICPCDYRDPDLNEYGACYCALYVSTDVIEGKIKVRPIPERRLPVEDRKSLAKSRPEAKETLSGLKYPVWRCKVCGYICARENPPEICPVCKAKKDRFERFI